MLSAASFRTLTLLYRQIAFVLVLRLYVRNFWSQEKRLPAATLERMLEVLKSLYSSKTERCFLSLATDLLLEMTSQSPDFQRHMFEYPLSECTFQVGGVPPRSCPIRARR